MIYTLVSIGVEAALGAWLRLVVWSDTELHLSHHSLRHPDG